MQREKRWAPLSRRQSGLYTEVEREPRAPEKGRSTSYLVHEKERRGGGGKEVESIAHEAG